jgi:GDP-L-fucose synthase
MKIYVAGKNGMVGSAISKAALLQNFEVVGKPSKELDLRVRDGVFEELTSEKPDVLIIAAAKVGGILANSSQPVEFLSDNLLIQSNLLDGAHKANIKNVIFLASSCVYPKFAHQPIKESELLSGYLESTNEAYAIAKIAGIKLVEAYRKEYGRSWFSLMPTNIYGERDNFNLKTAHVLPALINKFTNAVENKVSVVEIWGDGAPLREFLHVDDLADACLFLVKNQPRFSLINVGYGTDISIKDLALKISEMVGFDGKIDFNTKFPNGTPQKLLCSDILRGMGWSPKIDLNKGILDTINWFNNSKSSKEFRI